MTLPTLNRRYTFDALTELKDSYAVTSDAAAQVDSANKIWDAGDGRMDAMALFDVTALAIDGDDELYNLLIQGSTSSSFASGIVNLAVLQLGATEVMPGGASDSAVGTYELPFTNVFNDTIYPYIRHYVDGTGSTWSITHDCRVGRIVGQP